MSARAVRASNAAGASPPFGGFAAQRPPHERRGRHGPRCGGATSSGGANNPSSMRAAASRSQPDGVFNASAAPQAYLLTLGGERGRRATALLRDAGFAVHRMPPVVPRAAHATLLPPHFASQLGATWTNRSFSCMLTQREVYARIGRDHASTGRAFGYVFEDDIALHPSFAPAAVGGVLRAAEHAALASGAEVMYLGACRTYRKHGSWRVHVGRRPLGLSRCAVLCTHAYGVASAAAAGLYERISLALGSSLAPAMDQNLFRYAAQSPPSRWPLCVAMTSRVQPYVERGRPEAWANSPSSFDTPRQRQMYEAQGGLASNLGRPRGQLAGSFHTGRVSHTGWERAARIVVGGRVCGGLGAGEGGVW